MVILRFVELNSVKEELIFVSEEIPQVTEQDDRKQEILSAFQFWVNKNAWCYGDFEYINKKKTVEIYYENEDNKSDEFYGHLFFPLQSDEKNFLNILHFILVKRGLNQNLFLRKK